MTYTSENIIGVEFTVKGERLQTMYTISKIEKGRPVLVWGEFKSKPSMGQALKYLNNGTWIVKNSKA